jgi:uncharacterized protein (DUF2252 family)
MAMFARMRYLDVLYYQKDANLVLDLLPRSVRSQAELRFKQATKRGNLQALAKLTTVVDGQIRIAEVPPLVTHLSDELMGDHLRELMQTYLRSLRDDIREFLQRYTIVDYARKVVGVGSVGTRCYIILLRERDGDDPLFLQIKEATASVLEPRLGRSAYANHGQRVVHGQRRIQAASDLFLGWGRAATLDYYVRQLRDMKGGAQIPLMTPTQLIAYAALCGAVLARAHARSGDAATISGYLGKGDAFDLAITAFAEAYADQTERDHAALVAAVKAGRVVSETGT